MRLRSLRRLEEMELRRERDELLKERAALEDLLGSDKLQWKRIGTELRDVQAEFGKNTDLGRRRTDFALAAEVEDVPLEAMIEREPVTIVCSKMGWIRAMKGHVALDQSFKFKDGDEGRFAFHAETTDKIVLFGSNGRFYTLLAANLPGGRGMGEPVRLMVDLPNEAEIVDLFIHRPGCKIGRGLRPRATGSSCPQNEVIAQTRSGKQVLNVKGRGARAGGGLPARCRRSSGLRG